MFAPTTTLAPVTGAFAPAPNLFAPAPTTTAAPSSTSFTNPATNLFAPVTTTAPQPTTNAMFSPFTPAPVPNIFNPLAPAAPAAAAPAQPTISFSTKYNELPDHIQQWLAGIRRSMMAQRTVSDDLVNRGTTRMSSVRPEAEAYIEKLNSLLRAIQGDQQVVGNFMRTINSDLKEAETAMRTIGRLRTGTLLPSNSTQPAYFWRLIQDFERRVSQYRLVVQDLERHVSKGIEDKQAAPNADKLQSLMKTQHDLFIEVTAQVGSLHETLEEARIKYLRFRKRYYNDTTDPFTPAPHTPHKRMTGIEADGKQIAGPSSLTSTPLALYPPQTPAPAITTPAPTTPANSLYGFPTYTPTTPAPTLASPFPSMTPTPALSSPFPSLAPTVPATPNPFALPTTPAAVPNPFGAPQPAKPATPLNTATNNLFATPAPSTPSTTLFGTPAAPTLAVPPSPHLGSVSFPTLPSGLGKI
eukprot:TRINITY_DN7051_c0_g1_i4.p1 TRINITY_DN7051_c0_g1~~TRINITY_DN7051_c0_g1_i4.p1  ORF type:complete len:549 (-),score=159.53 TRINITY_DN7051_c0_g1_i4:174-1580(-)